MKTVLFRTIEVLLSMAILAIAVDLFLIRISFLHVPDEGDGAIFLGAITVVRKRARIHVGWK